MLIDTVQSSGILMLSVVCREGAGWAHLLLGCELPLYKFAAKQVLNAICTFYLYLEKQKSSLDFFVCLFSKNRYYCSSLMKAKWRKANFRKVDDTRML